MERAEVGSAAGKPDDELEKNKLNSKKKFSRERKILELFTPLL